MLRLASIPKTSPPFQANNVVLVFRCRSRLPDLGVGTSSESESIDPNQPDILMDQTSLAAAANREEGVGRVLVWMRAGFLVASSKRSAVRSDGVGWFDRMGRQDVSRTTEGLRLL